MDINIRLASQEDLPQIIEIEQLSFPPTEVATKEDFIKRFETFSEIFFVTVIDEKIIGFINGCTTNQPLLPDELYHNPSIHQPTGDYQTVFGLDVLPEYRKQGVATQLLNHLIKVTKERNKKGIILTSKHHIVPYYKKFGFKHQGISASFHGGATWNDMLLLF